MSIELSKVIQSYRERSGWTQDELGKQIGVSQQTIAKWESGKSHPRPKALQMLIQALKITGRELREIYPDSSIEARRYESPEILADMMLDDLAPLGQKGDEVSPSPTAPLSSAFSSDISFSALANAHGLKKMLAPVVNAADPSSRWDQVVPAQWGNLRIDYINDELYAEFLHAPTTAALTMHLRSSIYRYLWRYVTLTGGGLAPPNKYLFIVITLPQDQPIDFIKSSTRHFVPPVSNTQMLRRITSEALGQGIHVVLARNPTDLVSLLTNPSHSRGLGWEWPGHEWDDNPD